MDHQNYQNGRTSAKVNKIGSRPTESRARRRNPKYLRNPRRILQEVLKNTLMYFLFLYYWEFLLSWKVYGNPLGRGIFTVLFLVPIAVFMAAITGWSRNLKLNRRLSILLVFVFAVYYSTEAIYFSTFGSLYSLSMVGMGAEAITSFWWSLAGTLLMNSPYLLLLQAPTLLVAFGRPFLGRRFPILKQLLRFRGFDAKFHGIGLLAALFCWFFVVLLLPIGGKSASSVYGAYHSKLVDTDTGSDKLGALTNLIVELKYSIFRGGSDDTPDGGDNMATMDNTAISSDADSSHQSKDVEGENYDSNTLNVYPGLKFSELKSQSTDASITSICNTLSQTVPTSKNSYTGMFEGYNLIYICAESFSAAAVNETLTPTIYKLTHEGIVLNNYYNSFKNTTTNGEFAFLSGLWPDVSREALLGADSGSMPQSSVLNMNCSLGNMFSLQGVAPKGFHSYRGNYYRRSRSLPNMGFYCRFRNSMKLTEGWPASDVEMFEQTMDDYINEDQFLAYYMTFSGHGAYDKKNAMVKKNKKAVKELLGKNSFGSKIIGYYCCNYELDKALEYMLNRLAEAGKLDKTVIVMAGDHYPYYFGTGGYSEMLGEKTDADFGIYKSNVILWNPGIKEPIQLDTPCCNVDLLPTVLNLFNIPYDSRLYAGTDILGDGTHVAQLYNKNFVTDKVMFNASTGQATWLDSAAGMSEEQKQKHLEEYTALVNRRYSISLDICKTDFYKFVWETAGLAQPVSNEQDPSPLGGTIQDAPADSDSQESDNVGEELGSEQELPDDSSDEDLPEEEDSSV